MNQPTNTVEEDGPITRIIVHKVNGETVTVTMDTEDARRIPGDLVHALGGPGSHTTYALVWDASKKKMVMLHRWIMGTADGEEVDHIDRDGLNNRRSNLRACTRAKNAAAIQPQPNKTGFIGVREDQRGKTVKFDAFLAGKYIGRFTTAEAAARARDAAARTAYGEFAVLNFPEEAA